MEQVDCQEPQTLLCKFVFSAASRTNKQKKKKKKKKTGFINLKMVQVSLISISPYRIEVHLHVKKPEPLVCYHSD